MNYASKEKVWPKGAAITLLFSVATTALLSGGCATSIHTGGNGRVYQVDDITLLMPPFYNATNDDHAGRALTEIAGASVLERGIPLYQTEESILRSSEETAAGPEGRYQELAEEVGATHLLIGVVHEYRYKTDLDGDPAVGVTLRLVDARSGETVWQSTGSNVGYAFASLSSSAQRVVADMLGDLPIQGRRGRRSSPKWAPFSR